MQHYGKVSHLAVVRAFTFTGVVPRSCAPILRCACAVNSPGRRCCCCCGEEGREKTPCCGVENLGEADLLWCCMDWDWGGWLLLLLLKWAGNCGWFWEQILLPIVLSLHEAKVKEGSEELFTRPAWQRTKCRQRRTEILLVPNNSDLVCQSTRLMNTYPENSRLVWSY